MAATGDNIAAPATPAMQFKEYTAKCPESNCSVKFHVHTAYYESNYLGTLMADHRMDVHGKRPAHSTHVESKKNENEEKLVPTVNKGLHEMSREEWRQWTGVWNYWRQQQPAERNMTINILAKFPKISADIVDMPGAATWDETQLLKAIQDMMVMDSNLIRMRTAMQGMQQNYDETVSAFAKRLSKAAIACDFTVKFTAPASATDVTYDVPYTDNAIRDTFFMGLYDNEMLDSICREFKRRIPTLQEILTEAEGIESAGRSSGRTTSKPVAAMSTYQRGKRNDLRKPHEQRDFSTIKCHNCEKPGHTYKLCKEPNRYKGMRCNYCGIMNHVEAVCNKKRRESATTAPATVAAAAAVPMPTAAAPPPQQTGATNMISAKTADFTSFIFKAGDSRDDHTAPRMRVVVDLGHTGTRAVTVNALADTGASRCVISEQVWLALGGRKELLSPSTVRLEAANNTSITVLGEARVNIVVEDSPTNSTAATAVICSDTQESMFLSKKVLQELKVVHADFPRVLDSVSSITTGKCPCKPRVTAPAPPTKPPMALTENNREPLEKFLLDYYSASTFNNCTHQELPGMDGEALRVHIDDSVPPTVVNKPSPVSRHWEKAVRDALDADVRLGVIEEVGLNVAQTWCSPMHVVAKHNGEPRRVVDFTRLNKACSRQTHVGSTPFDLANKVPAGHLMSTMDAWNGFHSVPVHPADYHFFTFITPWGRYRYKMAPQGWLASGDAYTHRYDQITMGVRRHIKVIDDSLLWSTDMQQAWDDVTNFLSTVGQRGVVLNETKFHFAERQADFAGFKLADGTLRPLEKHIEAIRMFPEPRSLTDLRSFFALCEQVSYAYTIKEQLNPFRELIKTKDKKTFYWDEQLKNLFVNTRNVIADKVSEGIMTYDVNRVTTVETDWSTDGVGYWLRQKYCKCTPLTLNCCSDGWRVSMCGSRFCSPAESRYSPVEGELLAVTWALEKTRIFTLGAPQLYIVTDHRPLVGLIEGVEKAENRRLTNLRSKIVDWKIQKVWYRAGIDNVGPDALSRRPLGINLLTEHNVIQISVDEMQNETLNDATIQSILKLVRTSFPATRSQLPKEARDYWNARAHLREKDGLLYFENRIVIPTSLRRRILDGLHLAHQGVFQMILRAQKSFFWPGIQSSIQRRREACISCMESAPSHAAMPPHPITRPEYPFQSICIDYCEHAGHKYGVMVDRFSNWPCVWKASTASATEWLTSFCSMFGIPEELSTDGDTRFTSGAMVELLKDFGIKHRISSAYHPHSNTRAELGVKDVKRLLRENVDSDGGINNSRMTAALLTFKNTPDRDTRMSPAELVFGRQINDMLPTGTNWTDSFGDNWKRTMEAREMAVAGRHERCHDVLNEHTRALPPLEVGDHVALQNQHGNSPLKWNKRGVVVSVEEHEKYGIRVFGSGRLTYRNRQHLRVYIPDVLEQRTTTHQEQWNEEHVAVQEEAAATVEQDVPEVHNPVDPVDPVDPDSAENENIPTLNNEQSGTQPNEPIISPPRRSGRTKKGQTSKYNDYISKLCKIVDTLYLELPQHCQKRDTFFTRGGREVCDISIS